MSRQSLCMQPALQLHRLSFLLEKAADHALQQTLDLTFSQCMILNSLQKNPGCSQRSIARCRDLTQAAVSRQVDVLHEKKLISRIENAQNRREHILELTARGTHQLEKGMEIISAEFHAAFSLLKKGELQLLEHCVEKVLEEVRRTQGDPCVS